MQDFKKHPFQTQPALSCTIPKTATVRSIKWQILGQDRSLLHTRRKLYHCLMGLLCFSLYAFYLDREQSLVALLGIGGAFILGDLARLRYSQVNQVALRYFGKLMRREELNRISGNSFFILGLVSILLVFPKNIVLLSTLYLSMGDPIASIVGSLYGQRKIIGKKSLEGSLANFTATAIATYLFCHFYLSVHESSQTMLLALLGGMVSVISELFPLPVDDNFSIPVLSSLLLSVLSLFFSIL